MRTFSILIALAGLLAVSAASYIPRHGMHSLYYPAQPQSIPLAPGVVHQYGMYSLQFHGDDIAYAYLDGLVVSDSRVDSNGDYSLGAVTIRNGYKVYFAITNRGYSGGLEAKVSYGSTLRGVTRGRDDQNTPSGVNAIVPRYTNDPEKAKACITGCGNCDDASWTPASTVWSLCNAGRCGTGLFEGTGTQFVGPDNDNFRGTTYMVIQW